MIKFNVDGSKYGPFVSLSNVGDTRQVSSLRLRLSFLAVLLALPIAAEQLRGDETVNIAGTFNNWATQNNDWRMEQIDDSTFRFGRFWQAGRYEFKFAFDGAWDRHLGALDGGRLGMPGQNIELQIGRTGYYDILLNTEAKTWKIVEASPKELTPVITVRRESLDTYVLDSSDSLVPATKDNTTPEYEFSIEAVADGNDATECTSSADVTMTQIDGHRARLTVTKRGNYAIDLTMRMPPLQERRARVHRYLGDGFQAALADAPGNALLLYPLGDDRWGAPLNPLREDASLTLRSLSPDKTLPVNIPENLRTHRVLIVADAQNNDITFKRDGWHEFLFDSRLQAGALRGTKAETVDLVGSFNDWKPGVHPMRADKRGRFRTVIELPEGIHHYKFLVNGSTFLEDNRSDKRFRESDGNGGFNSGLLIGDDATTFGEPKPGVVNADALRHDPASNAYFAPIAANVARITLRTLANDAQRVTLQIADRPSGVEMKKSDTRYGFDYWSVQTLTPASGTLRYTLVAHDGDSRATLSASGAAADTSAASDLEPFSVALPLHSDTPDWAKRAMWYQIFPERFRNGDTSNDPPRTVPWSHKWEAPYTPGKDVAKGSPQDFDEQGTFFQYIFDRRYGGDLQGVREKLPYLRDLGVTAIYFNPIFHAESLHKYDASDYRHIDDRFGVAGSLGKLKGEGTDPATWQWSDSDKVFLDFLNEAHAMGFKVIIDGVFNHTGREFWAFQDVLKNGKQSEYADWFEIKSWEPFHYEAWDREDGSLPKLKHDEALGLAVPIREHLFAVTRRWMDPNGDGDPSDGIDGWRLDVASDINANFWRDWRTLVKSINPNAYIVAELWQESRAWLDGRTFDAVMNYPFARRSLRFVNNIKKATTPTQYKAELAEMYGWYRPQVNYVLQNLYDSHDTDRLASMCMNPDVEYDEANRVQDNGPNYNTSKPTPAAYQKQKLLATIQMTLLGAPMVYYGDEVGMYGADDPSDRKPMLWEDLPPNDDPDERIEPDVFEHYRRMIAIRNTFPALQLGDYEPIVTDDAKGIFAFTRTLGDESILVVLNNSDAPHRLDVPVAWPDGAVVVQLDDSGQCELVVPAADNASARPGVRPKPTRASSKLKMESGRLRGKMLAPRSGAIFTIVAMPQS